MTAALRPYRPFRRCRDLLDSCHSCVGRNPWGFPSLSDAIRFCCATTTVLRVFANPCWNRADQFPICFRCPPTACRRRACDEGRKRRLGLGGPSARYGARRIPWPNRRRSDGAPLLDALCRSKRLRDRRRRLLRPSSAGRIKLAG